MRLPDGSTKDLTPGEKHKAEFAGWSGDDGSFFVSTNERDPRFFDLYEYATDGYGRKLFYRNTEGYSLGPISRDKRYLALVRPRTSNDADIFLHDRKAGTTTLITKHTGQINYSPQAFTPDGKGLLITADSGREFAALQSHDIATGRRTTVYERILGHPRRRLLQGREVSDRRRQRGLPTRRPPARWGHAEAGRAGGDAARPGARHRALG